MCSSSAKAAFSATISKRCLACGQAAVYGNYEQRKRQEMRSLQFIFQAESKKSKILPKLRTETGKIKSRRKTAQETSVKVTLLRFEKPHKIRLFQ